MLLSAAVMRLQLLQHYCLEPMGRCSCTQSNSPLGQYAATIIHHYVPVMATADGYAEKADPKELSIIHGAMAALGPSLVSQPPCSSCGAAFETLRSPHPKVAYECTVRRR